MCKLLFIIFVLTFLMSACDTGYNSQNQVWQDFSSDEGNFKIEFPVTPTKKVKEVDTVNGKIQTSIVSASFSDVSFEIWFTDFPNFPNKNQDELKSFYDKTRDNVLKQSVGELISERDISLNTNLGREITFKTNKSFFKTHIYIIGKRQYQMITAVKLSKSEDTAIQQDINKFLNSFELTGN